MNRTDSRTTRQEGLSKELIRYDFGYQSVHFHLKQQKNQMALTQIMMAVRICGTRYRVYTGCKVEPAFWDSANGCCRNDGLLAPRVKSRITMLNSVLQDIRRRLDIADMKAAEHDTYLTLDDLRTVVRAGNPVSAGKGGMSKGKKAASQSILLVLHGIADKFDTDICKNGLKGSASTRKNYLYCCKRLFDFVKETRYPLSDFSKLDRVFYRKFTRWLNESKKYSASTVQLSVNCVRNLHQKAYMDGLTDVPACRAVPAHSQADTAGTKVYLNETELHKLQQVTVLTDGEKKVLDIFLLASYTGLRFSDVNRLDKAIISQGFIKLYQKKTNGFVSIPILKEIGSILMDYSNSPDGFPKLSQGYVNKMIKVLCKRAGLTGQVPVKEYRGGGVITRIRPKYELVSFHTARRSCITNLFRRGYSPNYLMTMSGHKSISSFQRYIRSNEEELASDFIEELKKDNALQL